MGQRGENCEKADAWEEIVGANVAAAEADVESVLRLRLAHQCCDLEEDAEFVTAVADLARESWWRGTVYGVMATTVFAVICGLVIVVLAGW